MLSNVGKDIYLLYLLKVKEILFVVGDEVKWFGVNKIGMEYLLLVMFFDESIFFL